MSFEGKKRRFLILFDITAPNMRQLCSKRYKMALTLRSIFRCMMEDGFYPIYEDSHILFNLDDNLAVLEYEDGFLSVRLFFSIDPETCMLFMEVSNSTMLTTDLVKPVIMDDRKNIMFSCETMCDTLKEFRKFFPRAVECIREAVTEHKSEMKRTILSQGLSASSLIGTDEGISSKTKRKPLS